MLLKKKILITGAAGFIGFHAVRHFVERGYEVVGFDNINDYYDVDLKYARLAECGIIFSPFRKNNFIRSFKYSNYQFVRADLTDQQFVNELFESGQFDLVCNLAAQAGVRYSIQNPNAYINSNINGFLNILEACRRYPVKHLVYASSSSVYGSNEKFPYSETDQVDTPLSLYAATKKSNELMAHSYSNLFGIPTTGVRFFTVYGPWGRPDMAPHLFMNSILNHSPIEVFNQGNLYRDFTYIDDIIGGLAEILDHAPSGKVPYKIYNIGRGEPVKLIDFIEAIEKATGEKAVKKMVDMQDGDVFQTFADTSALERDLRYHPKTSIQEGIDKFYSWYVSYYPGLTNAPRIDIRKQRNHWKVNRAEIQT
jgi:UDP-glucuronate 4-epimerase